ncbi:DUF262 domain-containing protein [Parathalassolituus penaei]|uniref:DUF262 domain-containing protein n=1 Tax=Parathalassolituus penaei TaxID=2997323 RepID=A0A9X3EMP8_9GAMM|nr:DUF262 domain-containing protein [Parathalassolituus penaei]MCY0967156.1 DUF262 domain-containing protein [Parathalassolituus penaei]
MAGKYEKAITIKDAIAAINDRDYLLPAIQRKFVWSSHQICVLFDSIMRGYPINSFMMWEVKEDNLKNDYKFYAFLNSYCQRFNEENPVVKTSASFKNFKAIIDGQQRLTSLYIGLCGTYAYKQPRKHWPSSQDKNVLPPRKLYLDLSQAIDPEGDESLMKYDFRFLTDEQYNKSIASQDSKRHWFCLHEVLKFPAKSSSTEVLLQVVQPYLMEHGLIGNVFACETLLKLYEVIRTQDLIHYFNETEQEIDHVLDVFIRTNSGGTKLDFSDLLMSIAIAHWDGDFREELDELTKQIHQDNEMGFYMERDWILKVCLMLTGSDVRFKVKNFHSEQVAEIQQQWDAIKACIVESLKLVRRLGINSQSLTSKNAVIPICFYLYNKQVSEAPLYKSINNLAKHSGQRAKISQWLYMVLLKGVFGGQADTILSAMRTVLEKNLGGDAFPLEAIVDRFRGTNKDLRFDEEYLDSMMNIQYGDVRCRALLHLLFPEMNPTEVFHIDHLHPKSAFDKKKLKQDDRLKQDDQLMSFYLSDRHWNSVANLHLLNHSQNISKNDQPLADWLARPDIHLSAETLLVAGVDMSFEAFPQFYEIRRKALKDRLRERVYLSQVMPVESAEEEFDEEVVEDSTV